MNRAPTHRRSASRSRSERGQVLPIVALAIVAIVAMVALVLEGGNAFAQQRVAQNGADAAANAGAVVLAERLGGATRTDAQVAAAVNTVAAENDIPNPAAEYTDISGNSLGTSVGGGTIPANAAGVRVTGTRTFGTFFARVLGMNQFDATADAIAVTGILDGLCPASSGCGILPVTFPVLISTCDGQSDLVPGEGPWALVSIDNRTAGNMATVPLCTNAPGSVGWLDLGDGNLEEQIENPNHGSFDVPTWLQTQPGNVSNVQSAINDRYAGKVVLIPMFDGTCRVRPSGSALSDCPAGQEGVGNNSWYHIPKFTAFYLDQAYVQGDVRQECNTAPGSPFVGGNGSVNCMEGWFIRYITQGPVHSGPIPPDDPSAIGIQLIR